MYVTLHDEHISQGFQILADLAVSAELVVEERSRKELEEWCQRATNGLADIIEGVSPTDLMHCRFSVTWLTALNQINPFNLSSSGKHVLQC